MTSSRISVMLVDDHAVVREGYRRLLEKQKDIDVVAEAADAATAYQYFKKYEPDVVVVDISMPGRGGIEVIRQVRQRNSSARVIVFTMHRGAVFALQAFRAGAKGFVTKSSPPELLVNAVREVCAGRIFICPEISTALAMSRLQDDTTTIETLSPREFEILRMILDAKSTEEIAEAFNLSPRTVANYHSTIKIKLSVASDIELMHFGLRTGLLPVSEGNS